MDKQAEKIDEGIQGLDRQSYSSRYESSEYLDISIPSEEGNRKGRKSQNTNENYVGIPFNESLGKREIMEWSPENENEDPLASSGLIIQRGRDFILSEKVNNELIFENNGVDKYSPPSESLLEYSDSEMKLADKLRNKRNEFMKMLLGAHPSPTKPEDFINLWLIEFFCMQQVSNKNNEEGDDESRSIFRNLLLPTFLENKDPSQIEIKHGVRFLSNRRLTQFEKKFHSAMLKHIKGATDLIANVPRKVKASKNLDEVYKLKQSNDDEVFDNLFGKKSKNGLKVSTIDKVLLNKPLFDLVLSKDIISNVIRKLHEQTVKDIETNIMSSVRKYFEAGNASRRKLMISEKINKSRTSKKPFTVQENYLAGILFLQRFIYRAKKSLIGLKKVPSEHLDDLEKIKQEIKKEMRNNGFAYSRLEEDRDLKKKNDIYLAFIYLDSD